MREDEFEQYVQERYYEQVDWYDRKAIRNQRIYEVLQWGLIILAALTPTIIAIGFCLGNSSWHWVPLFPAVLVAVLSAALKTFKYQENWIDYRTTCESLRKEIHFYRAAVSEYAGVEDPKSLFVERVEALISRENTIWLARWKENERGKGDRS